jgi:hypothetical protein
MFSGLKNSISEMANKSKESLSKIFRSNTGASGGEEGVVDAEEQKRKQKLAEMFYKAAGEKFIHELCESLYASENENSGKDMKAVLKENNFKGRFVNIVINNVTKSLNDPTTGQSIRDIVFGSEDNPGLRKYIQDIFKISTCEYKDNDDEIYPFTERVLQKLFKPDDPTIPNILIKTLTHPDFISGVGSILPSVVLTKMVEIIHLELNKPTENDPSPQTGGANGSITNPDAEESNIPVAEAIPVEEPKGSYVGFTKGQPDLDEKTTQIVHEIKEGLNNNDLEVANQSQKRIIDIIESEYPETQSFSSVIQQNILTAIEKIMERFKDVLYEEIKTKVIDNYVNKFLDENTIKLQILYSILSYDPKTQSEKCCDNSFAVSRKIFEESIRKMLVHFKGNNQINEETITNICLHKDNGIMHYLHQTLLERQTSGDNSLKAMSSSVIGGRKIERKNIERKKSKKRKSKKISYNKSNKVEQSKKSTKKYSRLLSKRKRSQRK